MPTKRWLNRNVMAISVSALLADANYEMVLSVLPLFLILGLGAPVYALGDARRLGRPPRPRQGLRFHAAMDTLGAVLGPGVAFLLISTGHVYRTVFLVAVLPGLLAAVCFAVFTRDPPAPRPGDRLRPVRGGVSRRSAGPRRAWWPPP